MSKLRETYKSFSNWAQLNLPPFYVLYWWATRDAESGIAKLLKSDQSRCITSILPKSDVKLRYDRELRLTWTNPILPVNSKMETDEGASKC